MTTPVLSIAQCLSVINEAYPKGVIILRMEDDGTPIINMTGQPHNNAVLLTMARVLNDAAIARGFSNGSHRLALAGTVPPTLPNLRGDSK